MSELEFEIYINNSYVLSLYRGVYKQCLVGGANEDDKDLQLLKNEILRLDKELKYFDSKQPRTTKHITKYN